MASEDSVMAPEPAQLPALYGRLAEISRAMLAAAQRGDWDAVTASESACAELVGQLRRCPSRPARPPSAKPACN